MPIPEVRPRGTLHRQHTTHVVGWPQDGGERFLDELNSFATQPQFNYTHEWRVGDLVVWDNRCTLHRAAGYDVLQVQTDLRRTTINEHGPEIYSTHAIGAPG